MHRRRGEWVLESAGHRRPWKPFSPPLAHTPSSVPAASLFSRFRLPFSHQAPIPASLRSSVSLSVGRNNFHLLHLCCSRFPSPVPSLSHFVLSTMFSPFPPSFLPIPGPLHPSFSFPFHDLHFPSCLDLSFLLLLPFLLLPGSCDRFTPSASLPDLYSHPQHPPAADLLCAPQSVLSGLAPFTCFLFTFLFPSHASPAFPLSGHHPFTSLPTAHFPNPFPRLPHLTPLLFSESA